MNITTLSKKFEQIGARMRFTALEPVSNAVRLNVRKDKDGAYFDVQAGKDVNLEILDVQGKERHLLLMARYPGERLHGPENKSKFLCGHDERSWFVAAIPESSSASSVSQAMEALKPRAVLSAQSKKKLKTKQKKQRKTEAYIRQGEWFFLPVPDLKVDEKFILRDEPIQRGNGKAHIAKELYRINGQTVYVNSKHPRGISAVAYSKLPKQERRGPWRQMASNPEVYVRGSIRHPDHKTIHLNCWHKVVPNTETEAKAMKHVAFLD